MHEEFNLEKMKLAKSLHILIWLVAIFLIAMIAKTFSEVKYVGAGMQAGNTITVAGTGDVEKAPDTARISFSVQQESKVVADAQKTVTDKVDAITAALEKLGIDESDIKTDNYSSYPQYNYPSDGSTPILRGYQVVHSVTVAVKNLDNVSNVLKVLGDNQVSSLSGPNFGFADDHSVADEARDKAIADAKQKAQVLAKSLGVRLVRIVSFSENASGGGVVPMYAKALDSAVAGQAAVAPTLPTGTQKVTSNVTVVYEIK
jgi:uncharacterized protein YggE